MSCAHGNNQYLCRECFDEREPIEPYEPMFSEPKVIAREGSHEGNVTLRVKHNGHEFSVCCTYCHHPDCAYYSCKHELALYEALKARGAL